MLDLAQLKKLKELRDANNPGGTGVPAGGPVGRPGPHNRDSEVGGGAGGDLELQHGPDAAPGPVPRATSAPGPERLLPAERPVDEAAPGAEGVRHTGSTGRGLVAGGSGLPAPGGEEGQVGGRLDSRVSGSDDEKGGGTSELDRLPGETREAHLSRLRAALGVVSSGSVPGVLSRPGVVPPVSGSAAVGKGVEEGGSRSSPGPALRPLGDVLAELREDASRRVGDERSGVVGGAASQPVESVPRLRLAPGAHWSDVENDGAAFLPVPNSEGFRLESFYHYPEIEKYEEDASFEVFIPEGEPSFSVPVDALFARMGAKSLLMWFLLENYPPHHTYVEPFVATGKLILAKPEAKIEIINDFDGDLASFHQWVQRDPERLAEYINALPNHEAVILSLRELLSQRKLKGIERAAAFYLGSQSAFNSKGDYSSYASSPHVLLDLSIDVDKVLRASKRLRRVNVRSTGYERIISSCNKFLSAEAYPPGGVFFYLDPPYWQTTGYKTFQGASSFGWKDQVRLSELCFEIHKVGNKFIQTNSDHEDLRRLYGSYKNPDGSPAFYLTRVPVRYSMAGSGEARGERFEFVISNFPLKASTVKRQQGLFGGTT